MTRRHQKYNCRSQITALILCLQFLLASAHPTCKWICECQFTSAVSFTYSNPSITTTTTTTAKPTQSAAVEVSNAISNPTQPPIVTKHVPIIDEPRPTVIEAAPFDPKEDAMAIKALTTDGDYENGFVEILTLRTLEQRLTIAKRYHNLYAEDMTAALSEKLTGNLRTLIVTLITPHDEYNAIELYNAAHNSIDELGRVGYDLSKTRSLLRRLPNEQLKATTVAYKKLFGVSLADDLKTFVPSWYYDHWNFTSTTRPIDEFTTEYYAKALQEALSGPKVDHHTLIEIVVLRSEYDLQNIKDVFQQLYGKSLYQTIVDALYKEDDPPVYAKAFKFLLGYR